MVGRGFERLCAGGAEIWSRRQFFSIAPNGPIPFVVWRRKQAKQVTRLKYGWVWFGYDRFFPLRTQTQFIATHQLIPKLATRTHDVLNAIMFTTTIWGEKEKLQTDLGF